MHAGPKKSQKRAVPACCSHALARPLETTADVSVRECLYQLWGWGWGGEGGRGGKLEIRQRGLIHNNRKQI
jgi:hypothetical protein